MKAPINIPLRKSLSADALISVIHRQFLKISDPRKFSTKKTPSIPFIDVLMSGLAVFGLKFPSLLQYDQQRGILDNNLKALYHVSQFPSDTYLRERLSDEISTWSEAWRPSIFVQRGRRIRTR